MIFEVDCSDQNIYAALQEQFEKIQNVINYCQKVIRSIPFIKSKVYSLTLSLVNVKYNFIGFHPKGIKFSFDVQNVVTAFIGEDLYKDKFTSLREAIQNAVDSCRYKNKVLKEDYSPHIKVFANKDVLVVEDNGAGMDEFIIENFFGRLASSFYEQEKIKTQFEAIGQFGVGVFSYFLLSEYVDIETKTATGNPLKFRFDKDPKSYFHFYDKVDRRDAGTTITMHLKKELIGRIVEQDVEDYIKKIFKHIEIPIELNLNNSKQLLEFQPFNINSEKELKNRLKLVNKELHNSLEIRQVTLNDDEVEGACGLIITKGYLKTFDYIRNQFDHEQFRTVNHFVPNSQIQVSQKGVFVNNYSAPTLELLIGDINIKKKVKINIDRNEFSDEFKVYSLIARFEFEILKDLFNWLETQYANDNERLLLTNNFLNNYNNSSLFGVLQLINSKEICSWFYLKVQTNFDNKIISIQSIKENYPEFVLISGSEDANKISLEVNKTIVFASEGYYGGTFRKLETLFNKLSYDRYIIVINTISYLIFKIGHYDNAYFSTIKKLGDFLDTESYRSILKSNSKKLLIDIWGKKINSIYYDQYYINYDHRFVQFIIKNYEALILSIEHLKILRSAFKFFKEIYNDKEMDIDASIKKLNDILFPLNVIDKFDEITMDDL